MEESAPCRKRGRGGKILSRLSTTKKGKVGPLAYRLGYRRKGRGGRRGF